MSTADSSQAPAAPEKDDPLLGTRVGDYQITGRLGEGDMGIVYAAEHATLGHRTACKVMRPEVMRQKDVVERFQQEARQVSKIRHLNLIDIFDIGELPDGRLYYVMEYLPGRPLSQVIAHKRLPFAEIVTIGRQVCAGLSAAHTAGLVHRDLSPDNLFLCERPGTAPLVKVMDFGVAKVVTTEASQLRLTRRGALIGTPSYMAPEQITEDPVDARTDVYALGAILFELCTGRVPYPGETLHDVLGGHLRAAVPQLDPEVIKAGVPAAMQDVIDKAMAKSPADRYPSAAALSDALDLLFRSTAVVAARPTRRILLSAVVALLLLAVIAGAVLLRPQPPQPEAALDLRVLHALALKILQEGLLDRDAAVRRLAVEALGQSHDPRHKDLLEPLLRDPDGSVQLAAARALGDIGNRAAVPALQARLGEPADLDLLAAGGEALLRLGERGGRAPLLRVQHEGRTQAAQLSSALALAEADDREAGKAVELRLRAALASGPTIADEALLILLRKAKRGDKTAQARLQTLVSTAEAPLPARLQAAACLLATGDERARTLLSQLVAAPGPAQVEAAQLLCAADDVSGQPVLRSALTQTGQPLLERAQAVLGLGSCGDKEDVRTLWQRLSRGEPSPLLRQAEAGALLRLCGGDPTMLAEQSTGWVQLALADDNPRVRAAGAAVLGSLDTTKVKPLLDKAMHDPNAEVRKAVVTALGRSDNSAALDALASGATDDNRGVRLQVWRSIAQVALSRRGDSTEPVPLPAPLPDVLRRQAAQGQGAEQVAAAGALLASGDGSQRSRVQLGLSSTDADAQGIAVSAALADPVLRKSALPKLVDDETQSPAVRTTAAAELLGAGDQRGVALLRTAARQGGPQGLAAALALQQVGELKTAGVTLLEQVRGLLDSTDAAVRQGTVALLAKLPLEQALRLLTEMSLDPDAAVRAEVAQTAAGLHGRRGGSAAGAPVLRALLDDTDAAVRAQAAALLAKQLRRSSRPSDQAMASSLERSAGKAAGKPTDPTPADAPKATPPSAPAAPDAGVASAGPGVAGAAKVPGAASGTSSTGGTTYDTPEKPSSKPSASATPGETASDSKTRRGFLMITAPPELEFQIDRQPAQTATGKPIEVTAGDHHVTHFGASREVTVGDGETVPLELSLSPVAQLVRTGIDAFGRKDYRRAKKALEKAGTLCVRRRDEHATCNLLAFELTYYLAQVYDAQDAWAEAMTEYEKILTPGFPGKVKAGDKAAVSAAVARLTPRLGRLRVSKLVGDHCQTVNMWMPPGRHRVNVGGGQFVQVRAQETIEVKGCP